VDKVICCNSGRGKLWCKNIYRKISHPTLHPPKPTHSKKIVSIVDQILSAKRKNAEADISHLEQKIDQLVYKLYNLTDEEIKIIEGGDYGEK